MPTGSSGGTAGSMASTDTGRPPSTTTAAASSSEVTGSPDSSGSDDSGSSSGSSGTGRVDCLEVEVQEWIGLGEGDNAIIALTIPQIGEPKGNNDLVQIELYGASPPVGVPIDLAAAPNDNYGTCDQCVRLLEDVVGNDIARQYFVDRGTITFTDLMMAGEMAGSITDLRFIEVELDGAFNSIPVEGGDCIVIDGRTDFDTLPGA